MVNGFYINLKQTAMKKKKSKKPKTERTPKPESDDGEFDDVMKALLGVPKKSNKNNKVEEPLEGKSEKD